MEENVAQSIKQVIFLVRFFIKEKMNARAGEAQ